MIRFGLIASTVLLGGCTNTSGPSAARADVAISAKIDSYSAAVEDRGGSFDLLYATVTAPESQAGKKLKLKLSPGGLPADSPLRLAGTKERFTVNASQLSKTEIPYKKINNLKEVP